MYEKGELDLNKEHLAVIERLIDGSVTEEECSSFETAVKNNDDFADEAADILRIHGLITSAADRDSECRELALRVDNAIGSREKFNTFESRVMQRVRQTEKTGYITFGMKNIVWISFAACLAVMAGAYLFNLYQMSQIPALIKARIMERQGKVLLERQGRELIIEQNMDIHAGDVIRTGSQARAVLQYTDEETRVAISEKTDVAVDEQKGFRIFNLKKGRLDCSVDKQPEKGGFRVFTPLAEAMVRGTTFSVDTDSNSSSVSLITGSVLFKRRDSGTHVTVFSGCEGIIRRDTDDIVMRPSGSPGKGLAAYWPGRISDSRLVDFSGNGRHGIIKGGVSSAAGIMGTAVRLDGKSGHINIRLPFFEKARKPFTISIWTRSIPSSSKRDRILFSPIAEDNGSQHILRAAAEQKGPGMFQWDSAGKKTDIGAVQPVWTHLAVTYDGEHIKTFHNARPIENSPAAKFPVFSDAVLGADRFGKSCFSGYIDEICVYDRALDQSEIAEGVLAVAHDKISKTPDFKTDREFRQYVLRTVPGTFTTGPVIFRDRFNSGLSQWRELGNFSSHMESPETAEVMNKMLRSKKNRKNPFRYTRIEKMDINGKMRNVLVLGNRQQGVLSEIKDRVLVGRGLEVSMNVLCKSSDTYFGRNLVYVYKGGWVKQEVYATKQNMPVKRWFNMKILVFPETDETGYGSVSTILFVDDIPWSFKKKHFYKPQQRVYISFYSIKGSVYISDITIRKLISAGRKSGRERG